MAAKDVVQVRVDDRTLKLTNLGKVLYPETGTTKGEVIAYYTAVAPAMLPHLAGRPVTRKRWPNGVAGESFFTKNLESGAPAWLEREQIEHSARAMYYPVVDSLAGLTWLAQVAALELHVPQWRFGAGASGAHSRSGKVSRGGTERFPDRIVFDLDPGPGTGLAECAQVALAVRERLGALGERMVPVTSGSKGLHLYVPMDQPISSEHAAAWALQVAEQLERAMPELVVSKMAKAVRPGKVFFDWSQNNAAKTTIAPYSLRGRDAPTVAAPRTWAELEAADLAQLDFRQVVERLSGGLDPMAAMPGAGPVPVGATGRSATVSVRVPVGADPRVEPDSDTVPDPEALTRGAQLDTYRAKRSAANTPEPVPSAGPLPVGGDDTFVIQEHHASRLHWDLRLERNGVLVSWAVPKGIPMDAKENRLAVQTEDHPMEYATFSGTIPAQEYGGGTMTIWDTGTYETLKWRDNEVMVDFTGTRVTGRYVLIRTRDRQWLLHRMKESSQHLDPAELAKPVSARRRVVAKAAVAAGVPSVEAVPAAAGPVSARELTPMLASSGNAASVADRTLWRYEGKWDGMRALAFVEAGSVTLRSRTGRDVTREFPELAELARLMKGHNGILDGEVVALDPGGRSDFGLLQQRMGVTKAAEVAAAAKRVQVVYLAFDVLELDGIGLLRKKYDHRRRLLEALSLEGDRCVVPEQLSGDIEDVLARTRADGWEGVIAKRGDSVYVPGGRNQSWLKIKHENDVEVVIVGWQPGQGNRAGSIGSLALARPDGDGLRYVGKVGTGFTVAMLDSLLARLAPLERKTPPVDVSEFRSEVGTVRWVRPQLVGEVAYAEFSATGLLRQSRWRGLRPDKSVTDVT
ncbi:ATP-dependent DNA ligase [Nakamurella silvestris]|nr:ATP-dependent DNA ligase [Nakamurella silvestris]